jgi:hypothetical protein
MLDRYSRLRHGQIIGGDGRTSRPRGARVRPGLDRVSVELCGNRIILAGEIRAKEGGIQLVPEIAAGVADGGPSQSLSCGGAEEQKVRRASLGPSLLMVSCRNRQGFMVHVWDGTDSLRLIGWVGWRNGDCSGS